MDRRPTYTPNRRDALKALGALATLSAVPALSTTWAAASQSRAKIVIAGAGAAGLTAASRLRAMMPNAQIVVVDARERHYFQPGFTLVGSGVWRPEQTVDANARFLPRDVTWVKASVAEFDLDANRIVTSTGESVPYDFLMVATGLHLDYERIEGMSEALIGEHGIASIYAGPEAAFASWRAMQAFVETGGHGVFGRPATEMKCAGAPLKITLLTEDRLTSAGGNARSRAKLTYFQHNQALFAVPPVNVRVGEIFADRGIDRRESHVMRAIDPGAKRITFQTPDGMTEVDYDFVHVVPPMRAPDAVMASALPWQEGPLAADGWIEVDRSTMQHLRYPNVYAIGDVAGVPRGKTAASVKWHTPVACRNMVSVIEDRPQTAIFNGYTSCPLVTRVGQAMLIEFDYDGTLIPSFPFIDPLEESWVSWVIEERALLATYNAMLRGLA